MVYPHDLAHGPVWVRGTFWVIICSGSILVELFSDSSGWPCFSYKQGSSAPSRVLWCLGIWQNSYKDPIQGVEINYMDALPKEDELKRDESDVIVCDDMMNEVKDDTDMAAKLTRISHHLSISIIFIVKNLFSKRNSVGSCHSMLITLFWWKTFVTRIKWTILPSNLHWEKYQSS